MSVRFIRLVALSLILLLPCLASADPCDVPEGPPGTITLPPDGCGYLSPADVHVILDDLPPGTTIEIGVEHKEFHLKGTRKWIKLLAARHALNTLRLRLMSL